MHDLISFLYRRKENNFQFCTHHYIYNIISCFKVTVLNKDCNEGMRWSFIHTSDKRPSHSHCYQVNDCQVTYIKNISLLKGGLYFYTEKNTFLLLKAKIFYLQKVDSIFALKKNTFLLLQAKIFYLQKVDSIFVLKKNMFLLL